MKSTQPKLIPTAFCLAVTALTAATLPYPKFQTPVKPLPVENLQSENSSAPQKQLKDVQVPQKSML